MSGSATIVNSGAAGCRSATVTVSGPPAGSLTVADSSGDVATPVDPSAGDTSSGRFGALASTVSSKSDGARLCRPSTSVT